MKKIIYLLLAFCTITTMGIAQERSQKQAIRGGGGGYTPSHTPSFTPSNTPSNRPYNPTTQERNQKLQERDRNRAYYNSHQPNYHPYYGYNYGPYFDGWYGLYPRYGWYGYHQYWYYDRWGYRNPYRVYLYEDGTTDTLKAKPLHGTVGVSINSMPEMGAWFTIGRSFYFIGELNFSFQQNKSVYYPQLSYDKVMEWNDQRLPDYQRSFLFAFGVGKKIYKDLGVHAELGLGTTEVRSVFYDEMHILSNNGQYSIPDYRQNVATIKVGMIGTLAKKFSVKIDYDLGRHNVGAGLGFNF